jgi:hypothetical protein
MHVMTYLALPVQQESSQHIRRMRPRLGLRDILRRALSDDASAAVAAFGAKVDDPIRFGDHIEVVLDDDDGVAGGDQAVQDTDELLDVSIEFRSVTKATPD